MNPPAISIGDLRLSFISGGGLRIDGGNMFGVVPRVMWEKVSPPDQLNRIRLETNCILVETPHATGLVDTGYGGKTNPKQRQRHALEEGEPLLRNLAAAGVEPRDIDWLLLTHLHFDHVGGATRRDDSGHLQPTFPRARCIVQRTEWEDATGDLPELAGAYFVDDFLPIEEARLIDLVEGEVEIAPGVIAQLTGGHTRGHQIVRFASGGQSAVVPADLCPTSCHLPPFWTMAYEQFPLDVRRLKPALLDDIVANNRMVLFSHDPDVLAARITKNALMDYAATPICTR